MKTVIVEHSQSLLDIALQVYGNAEAVVELAMLNNLSITDDISPAQTINYNPNNNPIAAYFGGKQYRPATDITDEQLFKQEGIDFWTIDDDFIVQPDDGIDYDIIGKNLIIA